MVSPSRLVAYLRSNTRLPKLRTRCTLPRGRIRVRLPFLGVSRSTFNRSATLARTQTLAQQLISSRGRMICPVERSPSEDNIPPGVRPAELVAPFRSRSRCQCLEPSFFSFHCNAFASFCQRHVFFLFFFVLCVPGLFFGSSETLVCAAVNVLYNTLVTSYFSGSSDSGILC